MSDRMMGVKEFLSAGLGQQPATLADLTIVPGASTDLCIRCRGGRMLCGKTMCPLLAKARTIVTKASLISTDEIDGSTPPSVFVGRMGYPKVYIGPMIPPYHGDTTIFDTPEMWTGKSIQEIIDLRYSLIRGKTLASVFDAQEPFGIVDRLQELALSRVPAESEAHFTRRPNKVLTLSDESQPFGPSAPLKSFNAWGVKADRDVEKAYYDRDLNAADAIVDLHKDGIMVTRIQRAFSMGMFGVGKRRKLVPTRWSITAVDSTISNRLLDDVKHCPTIDEYRVHTFQYLDNRFVITLMPANWCYESIEAWFPGTAWNKGGKFPGGPSPAMIGDYESFEGRTKYASMGGCYYACRLAIAEHMLKEQRQCAALVLREIHPGYILPVGVWNVRESVRTALATPPAKFETFNATFEHVMSKLSIPRNTWMKRSRMLRDATTQTRMHDYF